MEEKTFNRQDAAKTQNDLIKDKKYPEFPPTNGTCYSCGKNIYDEIEHTIGTRTYKSGISVENAGKSFITGCPHCNRSYCD